MRLALILLIGGVAPLLAQSDALAGNACDYCGCTSCVRKVCVPKKTEKEITKVCWDYKCEDVCIPGPSKCCGEKCKEDKCGCWTYRIWEATCARVKTRRVPVKTEVKRKVPAIEWVVEYRCANCCDCPSTAAPPPWSQQSDAPPPSPPLSDAPPPLVRPQDTAPIPPAQLPNAPPPQPPAQPPPR